MKVKASKSKRKQINLSLSLTFLVLVGISLGIPINPQIQQIEKNSPSRSIMAANNLLYVYTENEDIMVLESPDNESLDIVNVLRVNGSYGGKCDIWKNYLFFSSGKDNLSIYEMPTKSTFLLKKNLAFSSNIENLKIHNEGLIIFTRDHLYKYNLSNMDQISLITNTSHETGWAPKLESWKDYILLGGYGRGIRIYHNPINQNISLVNQTLGENNRFRLANGGLAVIEDQIYVLDERDGQVGVINMTNYERNGCFNVTSLFSYAHLSFTGFFLSMNVIKEGPDLLFYLGDSDSCTKIRYNPSKQIEVQFEYGVGLGVWASMPLGSNLLLVTHEEGLILIKEPQNFKYAVWGRNIELPILFYTSLFILFGMVLYTHNQVRIEVNKRDTLPKQI
ncbi:hypothetical protein [Candidatus Lokiarchaeum ossiferum]|uniref:hypothetical protein n=1 Tax=Candidatus Lokiarchaeum ossiferum TaxID=2951803 RepID=UPI00352C4808